MFNSYVKLPKGVWSCNMLWAHSKTNGCPGFLSSCQTLQPKLERFSCSHLSGLWPGLILGMKSARFLLKMCKIFHTSNSWFASYILGKTLTQSNRPSPGHHHVYVWSWSHSQSWVVDDWQIVAAGIHQMCQSMVIHPIRRLLIMDIVCIIKI